MVSEVGQLSRSPEAGAQAEFRRDAQQVIVRQIQGRQVLQSRESGRIYTADLIVSHQYRLHGKHLVEHLWEGLEPVTPIERSQWQM